MQHTTVVPSSSAPTRRISSRGTAQRLRALKPEILALVEGILDSGVIEKGPYNQQLARRFQELCGAQNRGVPCDSGTDALKMALLASNIGPGDEVIVPELSFISTVSAVHEVGATPVFVDIEEGTFTMDPTAAEAAITARTKGIIPVCLFGMPVDADAFLALGKTYSLSIIGDAAQAHGAEYKGRRVGNLGFDYEIFSLAAVKNVGGWRFGGIVMFKDPSRERLLHQLVDLGRSPDESYLHSVHGLRANMDEFNAAVITLELEHLEEWNAQRRRHAEENDAALACYAPRLATPARPRDRRSVYWQYCLTCETKALRDQLHAYLRARLIETAHYPCVLSDQPSICLGKLPYSVATNTVARKVVDQQLWLPFWPEMPGEDRAYIIASIHEFFADGHARRKYTYYT